MERREVSLFILIDALGWSYIKDRPFLGDIAVTKRPVKSILGFSSGVIPSILTGKYPQEHKHWSLYFYSPKTSPFSWTKAFCWLPKRFLNSKMSRKLVEEVSKRVMGYKGYFETYLIPVDKLHLFDICENKNIYAPQGIKESDSIFDILQKNNINYECFTYSLKDKDIFNKAKESIEGGKSSSYFIYLCESDALLHSSCKDKEKVNEMMDYYENSIREIFHIAKRRFEKVNLYVFSDHGMAQVKQGFNVRTEIEELGFKMPQDYIAFYDSTMARFWFFNPEAKEKITALLQNKDYGRILSEEEKKAYGIDFEVSLYGELIFLMNTGSVIIPSFMGNKVPQGMHGFDVNDESMDAILISNNKIEEKIENVKDIFNIMLNSVAAQRPSCPASQLPSAPELQSVSTAVAQCSSAPVLQAKKIKVLYFLNSVVRAGAEEHVLRLIERLNKDEFEPILVCPQELINLMQGDLERLKIKYYPVCIRRWRNLREINKFLKILKVEKPDIVNSHQFFATMFAAPLAKLAGVSRVAETAHLREGWRKGIKKVYFVDRFFYRFVDKIIAVSQAVKDYLVTEKKLSAENIEVIHNGIDIDKFKPVKKNNDKYFSIGVIGRLEPQKGHKYFLEAVKMLNGKYPKAKFFIVGEGSLRSLLEKSCYDLKIEDRVEFLGFRRNIVSVLNELDLVVLPSLYEGLPLIALEAGAMAKPIIATRVDGSSEVVINNQTGLLVNPKDSKVLKSAMESLLDNKELLDKFGRNARGHIEKEFDIKRQINKTEELYKRVISL